MLFNWMAAWLVLAGAAAGEGSDESNWVQVEWHPAPGWTMLPLGEFLVRFPCDILGKRGPQIRSWHKKLTDPEGYIIKYNRWECSTPKAMWSVEQFRFPRSVVFHWKPDVMLDRFQNNLLAKFGAHLLKSIRLTLDSSTLTQSWPGRRVTASLPDRSALWMNLYLVDDRLYILEYTGQELDPDAFELFLDGFMLDPEICGAGFWTRRPGRRLNTLPKVYDKNASWPPTCH